MKAIIKNGLLKGDVVIPPSKSLSHRAIIAACLAEGKSVITNVLYSDDIIATLDAMEACGAQITRNKDSLEIIGSKVKRINNVIDAHESGSTIRFMIPIALTNDEPITFIGRNHLVKRPLDVYTNIFNLQNIKYEKGENHLPLTVYGGLKSGVYEIRGDISSQFITGLLFALPMLNGDSKIVITSKLESKGYIDLTLDILAKFGIVINVIDELNYHIPGNQSYKATDYMIEGDYSQSAFWLVANMLGSEVNLLGMNLDSRQGDKKILKDIEAFGGEISFVDGILTCKRVRNIAPTIDFSQSPDLGPALSVLASLTKGDTKFIEASRLRIKECDRITCMKEELNKLGAKVSETPDTMSFEGVSSLNGSCVNSWNDHRIAMSLAIAGTVINGDLCIDNPMCVKKSYPHFFLQFESVGGHVTYEE